MKAAFLVNSNEPLVMREVPTPVPAAHEVLIRLSHSSLNHRDVKIQKGLYAGAKSGLILGSDGLGTVVGMGAHVGSHLKGQQVIINPSHNWGDNPAAFGKDFKILGNPDAGTFAEYICVSQNYIFEKPAHLTDVEAAALPLAGLTTYRAVVVRGAVKPEERVLITGIGAGTALLALQFVIASGAEAYVTSGSAEKIKKAQNLGAQGGFNYKEKGWIEQANAATGGFDVVIDSASGSGFAKLLEVTRPGGRIVFFGGTDGPIENINPNMVYWKNISLLGTTMGTTQNFEDMLAFSKKHNIKPIHRQCFRKWFCEIA